MRCIFYAILFSPILCLHANPVIVENSLPGTPGWWLKNPSRLHEVEGFASKTSVNLGEKIDIFIKTTSPRYTWELFRLGYYNGVGARQILAAKIENRINQPACTLTTATGLVDCPWNRNFSIQTSIRWVSGVYVVRLTETTTQKDSFILFVIRDDARATEVVYTHSVTTDVAYSRWGDHDLYNGAVKVSFNRPISPPPFSSDQDPVGTGHFFAYYDYNLIRWLERQGYDTKYITNIDVHEDYLRFASSKIFLSVGHDEYWSGQMRQNLNTFRALGRSVLFLSSNTMYWQVRFEPDSRGQANRIMTCYKNANTDPELDPAKKTVRFRDAPLNNPEDEFMGVLHDGDFPTGNSMTIRDASHWIFEGTGLRDGDSIPGMIGYESDRMGYAAPTSIERLAATKFMGAYGGVTYTDMTIYRTDKGGYIFSPGSMQWIWGLDDYNVSSNTRRGIENPAVQSITRNIFYRILYSQCTTKLYPTDKVLIDLRFLDAAGTTHFKDHSAYERSALCFAPNCPTLLESSGASQALDFASHGQYVDLGIEPSIRGNTGFSIAFSVKMQPGTDEFIVLQQRDDQNTPEFRGYEGSFQISIDAAGGIGVWTYSLQNEFALWMKSNRLIKDGNWHAVVISRLASGAGVISIDNVEDTYRIFDRIDDLKPHTVFLGHDPLAQRGFIGQIGYLKIWTH